MSNDNERWTLTRSFDDVSGVKTLIKVKFGSFEYWGNDENVVSNTSSLMILSLAKENWDKNFLRCGDSIQRTSIVFRCLSRLLLALFKKTCWKENVS